MHSLLIMFQIAIQAVVGSKVVARENLKAFRKDVTAKLVSIQRFLTTQTTTHSFSTTLPFEHTKAVIILKSSVEIKLFH